MASRGNYPSYIWDWELKPSLGPLFMLRDAVSNINRTRDRIPGAPFAVQFNRTMYLTATDPRDKVYGILGICSWGDKRKYALDLEPDDLDWRGPLEPDYSKPAKRVFARAVVEMIMMGLEFTYNYLPLETPHNPSGLGQPSWVPDLTHPLRQLDHPSHPFYLCPSKRAISESRDKLGHRLPWVSFSSDAKILYAGGLPLGEVIAWMQWPDRHVGISEAFEILRVQINRSIFDIPSGTGDVDVRRDVHLWLAQAAWDALLPPM